jgi:large subunit ribosomal protein L35
MISAPAPLHAGPPAGNARQSCAAGRKWHAESRIQRTPKEETEMPKMKTKSSAKKRFKMTATGLVKAGQAGKRHGMIKRTAKFIRNARGTSVLNAADATIVKKYMPYAR